LQLNPISLTTWTADRNIIIEIKSAAFGERKPGQRQREKAEKQPLQHTQAPKSTPLFRQSNKILPHMQ
jgi:hypothetical protein